MRRFAWLLLLLPVPMFAQHSVTLTAADTSCTSSDACSLQVYRATLTGSNLTTCSGLVYSELAGNVLGTTTATTETWSYTDNDPNLTGGYTYCYYVTATYLVSPDGPSPSSGYLPATIPTNHIPAAPVIGTSATATRVSAPKVRPLGLRLGSAK